MGTNEPEYCGYSLDDLEDARRHIDAEAHPERAKRIDAEIERWKSGARTAPRPLPPPTDPRFKFAGRRFAAFAIDLMALATVWALVDNIVYFPIPTLLSVGASTALFLAYFTVGEALFAATLGKHLMELTVSGYANHAIARSLARAAIVAAVVWVDWNELLLVAPLDRLPVAVMSLAAGVTLGLGMLGIAFLFWVPPVGQMLHDRVTGTLVITHENQMPERGTDSRSRLTAGACVLAVGFGIIIVVGFNLGVLGVIGRGSPWEYVTQSIRDARHVDQALIDSIFRKVAIRTRVGVQSQRVWTSHEGSMSVLTVSVWMPAAKWNSATHKGVVDSVVATLSVEPGAYDKGELVIHTGTRFLRVNKTFSLNLP